MDAASDEVTTILLSRHKITDASRADFSVLNQATLLATSTSTNRVFTVLLGAVAAISLLVGGIGVMNIMLIAVKERTREIGVRKALGATTSNIQRQFFLEGFFLTMLSGGSGMLLAIGLCALINLAPMPGRFAGMLLSWEMALTSLALLVLVGVVTSTYAARRAAELPPVEALRFEM